MLHGIDGLRRPLAAVCAELLFAQTPATAGRPADADAAATGAVAKCIDLGLSGLLVDAGLR